MAHRIAIFTALACLLQFASGGLVPGGCGVASVPMKSAQRIIGGIVANQNSIPWIVSLRFHDGWHFCGGSLIRVNQKEESDVVVTAAHCVEGMDKPDFEVHLGAHFMAKTVPGEEAIDAAQFLVHPKYKQPEQTLMNDIALVKLARPVKFCSTIQPICLPAQNETLPDGTFGIAAGWGARKALVQVSVPLLNGDTCKQIYGNPRLVPEAFLCSKQNVNNERKGICAGDSGGPYFFKGKEGYTLHGVNSWVAGCTSSPAPDAYARVANNVDWIQKEMKSMTSVKA